MTPDGTAAGGWALYIWLALPMGLLAVRLLYPERLKWRWLLVGWLVGGWAGWLLVNLASRPAGTEEYWIYLKPALVWGWLPTLLALVLYLLPYGVAVLLKRRLDQYPPAR